MAVDSEEDLKATVEFQGGESIHNKTELKRRPVRAEERTATGRGLQHQLPRAMYLEKLEKLDGCRDKAPTPQVLKNISWEVRQKNCLHSNYMLSLQMMVEKKREHP